ncbi:calcium/sodium antiporter [Prolixibacteraceae bacterium JC049]|nr:calcium/sodium antiporter [Prolixibacteraceae bacterium JC049]
MTILLLCLALLLSFFLLARIVDNFFVDALDHISNDLRLSSDAAGATLMAVGSSAPELFVALFAVLKPGEHQGIGVGSIVGSALFNLLVIVGAAALVRRSKLTWQPIVRDIIFYFLAVGLLLWGLMDGEFNMMDAGIFIGLYVLYVVAVIYWRKILPYKDNGIKEEEDIDETSWFDRFSRPADKVLCKCFPSEKNYYWVFTISIVVIAALSWVLVEAAVELSAILNIPEAIVGLTVLAIGTSIPDLFSSLVVAKQGRADMAVSNAIGSNIFDILIGLGVPFMIYMIIHGGVIETSGGRLFESSSILMGSIIVLIVLLFSTKWIAGKRIGWILILLYVAYLANAIFNIY